MVKDFLKQVFIPHESNEYKPHFWRKASLSFILFVIVAVFFSSTLQRIIIIKTDFLASVYPKVLTDLTNADRHQYNLGFLKVNPVLERAAMLKAEDMVSKGYFAHRSPDGVTPWYWFREAGYDFAYAGENLAIHFSDSAEVDRAWMNSPSHRANILSSNFTEIGIAVKRGFYEGKETTFVVQMFGSPKEEVKVSFSEGASDDSSDEVVPVAQTATTSVLGAKLADVSETGTTTLQKNSDNDLIQVASSTIEFEEGKGETFVAVKGDSVSAIENVSDSVVENTKTETREEFLSSFSERVATNPSVILKKMYLAIASVLVIALILFIFIEIRRQHPKNIVLGFALLVLMSLLVFIYTSIFSTSVIVL